MSATAPLPAETVEQALAPLGEARMLPADAYTSADMLAWELQHLFAEGWVCVGRAVGADAGAQRAVALGNTSAVLVRGDDGSQHAFANVCRHRGHELLEPGSATVLATIRCPYHGWTYSLDGSLTHSTGGDVRQPELCSLGEMPSAEWLGWTFVNASGAAEPFEQSIAGLDEILGPHEPARLVPIERREYDVRANWKVLHENYQECLHCPRIHPELCTVSPPESGDNIEPGPGWVGGWMDLRENAETMSMTGALVGRVHPGLDQVARRRVAYFAVLPNLLVSAHPDYVLTHRLQPIAPDITRVECEWLVDPRVAEIKDAVELWDITNRQDWAACESVQRGLASGAYRPGPILQREDAVHHFVGLIARRYLGRSDFGRSYLGRSGRDRAGDR